MVDRSEPDDDLAAALRALPREMPPPSHIGEALASVVRGPRAASSPRASLAAWRVAVAASLVAAAFAAGRLTAPRAALPASGDQRFAFLLYGGATSGAADDRAAEYAAWAVEARRQGRAVTGERLADASWTAGQPLADVQPLRGFFIVRARDSAEALNLARQHPHATAGTVVVRRVDTP